MGIFNEKVLVTLNEEEIEMFVDVEIEVNAINEMQDNLLTQMKVALKKKQNFWDVIQKKYDIDGALRFNKSTGEVTRAKG